MNFKRIVITDASNLMFRNLFPAHNEDPLDGNFKLWKRLTLHSLIDSINTHSPDRSIIAMDSRKNWRSLVYEGYKCNREAKRKSSKVDFDKFFPVANDFWKDLKETFTTFVTLEVELCEADDCIAILSRDLLKDSEVINISTDGDFYQLFIDCKNYKQYHPSKREFITVMNPKRDLEYKIIDGDAGDDIPPIYTLKHKVWKRSKKETTRLLDTDLDEFLLEESNKEKYERNKTLIDFKCIPFKYQNAIKESYEAIKTEPLKRNAIMDFLRRHDLRDSFEDVQGFAQSLRRIS
jgi:5'-3' exonuclease